MKVAGLEYLPQKLRIITPLRHIEKKRGHHETPKPVLIFIGTTFLLLFSPAVAVRNRSRPHNVPAAHRDLRLKMAVYGSMVAKRRQSIDDGSATRAAAQPGTFVSTKRSVFP